VRAGVSGKAGDIDGDEPGGDGIALGPNETGRRIFGRVSRAVACDLAGGAAPLLGRARVVVCNRRQAEEGEEGDENDRRTARAKQAFERSERKGSSRHGRGG
jgi:hypothetical protein